MDPQLIWAILFLAVALALFFAELLVPSGGLISVFAAVSLISGIVMLFKVNTSLGLIGAIVVLLAMPFLLAMAIKLWPNTPMARALLLKNQPRRGLQEEGVAGHDATVKAQELIGQTGEAITDLRPVGICLLSGERIECIGEGNVIRSGSMVRVTSADGMHVRVRPVE